MANLVIIDDHELVMDSLKYLIEQESDHHVIGKFVSSELARAFLLDNHEKVDLLILDVQLPDMNGIEFTAYVHEKYPRIKIVMLSQFSHQEFILSSIKNGASGYLLKSTDGQDLTEAIEKVLQGKQYLCQEATRVLIQSNRGENLNMTLTPREKEVLKLIADGLTAKEIGEELFIEASTVDYHKKNLKVKLNAHKISDLTKCAIELGIVDFKRI